MHGSAVYERKQRCTALDVLMRGVQSKPRCTALRADVPDARAGSLDALATPVQRTPGALCWLGGARGSKALAAAVIARLSNTPLWANVRRP